MLSKNDEGKNEVLSYLVDVNGIIITGLDSVPWKFFIDDYATHKYPSTMTMTDGTIQPAADISGWMKN